MRLVLEAPNERTPKLLRKKAPRLRCRTARRSVPTGEVLWVIDGVVPWGWDSQGSSGGIPCPDTEPRLKTDALNPIHLPPGMLVAMTCFDSRPSPLDDRDIDNEDSLSFTGREGGELVITRGVHQRRVAR